MFFSHKRTPKLQGDTTIHQRVTKIKSRKLASVDEEAEQQDLSYTAGGGCDWYNYVGNIWQDPLTGNTVRP